MNGRPTIPADPGPNEIISDDLRSGTGLGRERRVLLGQLAAQRRHVLGIVAGLSDDQLWRPVLPSGWHCLGMIKHLAVSDEHYWFRCVVGGEPMDHLPVGQDAEWQVGPAEDVLGLYRDEIERSDAIISATSLDAAPRQADDAWVEWGMDFPDLRSVIMHVVTETAVHAGHLDAACELIDGRQWVVLSDSAAPRSSSPHPAQCRQENR